MKSVLRIIVFVPLALIILFFALSNRIFVPIRMDPFAAPDDPSAIVLQAPLFMVALVAMAIGVLAGGLSSWLGHLPTRRDARVARAEARKTRLEIEKLRQQALANPPPAKGGR